jgi:hypothetical protein
MLRNLATLLGEFLTLLDALNTEPVPTLTTILTRTEERLTAVNDTGSFSPR